MTSFIKCHNHFSEVVAFIDVAISKNLDASRTFYSLFFKGLNFCVSLLFFFLSIIYFCVDHHFDVLSTFSLLLITKFSSTPPQT